MAGDQIKRLFSFNQPNVTGGTSSYNGFRDGVAFNIAATAGSITTQTAIYTAPAGVYTAIRSFTGNVTSSGQTQPSTNMTGFNCYLLPSGLSTATNNFFYLQSGTAAPSSISGSSNFFSSTVFAILNPGDSLWIFLRTQSTGDIVNASLTVSGVEAS